MWARTLRRLAWGPVAGPRGQSINQCQGAVGGARHVHWVCSTDVGAWWEGPTGKAVRMGWGGSRVSTPQNERGEGEGDMTCCTGGCGHIDGDHRGLPLGAAKMDRDR